MGWATSSGWRWDSGIAVWVVQSLYTVRCGNGVFLGLGVSELCGVAGGIVVERGGYVVGDALSNVRICLVKRAV